MKNLNKHIDPKNYQDYPSDKDMVMGAVCCKTKYVM